MPTQTVIVQGKETLIRKHYFSCDVCHMLELELKPPDVSNGRSKHLKTYAHWSAPYGSHTKG